MSSQSEVAVLEAAPVATAISRRSWRQIGMVWAGIALSLVCLALAMRGTNFRETGLALGRAHLWLAVPLLLLHVPFYLLKALRWRLLLVPVRRTRTLPLVAPMMIGFMGNNVLPARLGELIRMYLGARVVGVARSQVLATLVLERIFDFIAVLVFFGLGVVTFRDVPPSLVSAAYVAAAMSAGAMMMAAAFVAWTTPVLRVTSMIVRVLPAKLAGLIQDQMALGASGMAALRDPRLLGGIVVASLLPWFLMASCIYLSFRAVELQVPVSAAFVVLAATVFGVMVPAAPGFFGTLHLSFVLALTPFGVGEGQAMAAAVFYHIVPYIGVVATGLWFLHSTGLKLRDIETEVADRESRAARSIYEY